MRDTEDSIAHYGVKGMRWGVRKKDTSPTSVEVLARPGKRVRAKGGAYQPPSEDAIKAAILKQQARKSTVDSLSNKELQDLIQRMNLEQSYNRLDPKQENAGVTIAKVVLKVTGNDAVLGGLNLVQKKFPDMNLENAIQGVEIAKGVNNVANSFSNGKKKK